MIDMEKKRQPILQVEGLKKRYRLGQFNADSLQEELRLRWERRRKPAASVTEENRHIEGNELYALNGVNLTVYPGERLGIIGRNGAGKSTLLKIICRITAPTAGRIRLWGRVVSMLEVGTGFHGDMTGRENIYMNGAILGMTRAEIDRKMEDIIDFSEVRDFIDTPVKRYSSGMFVKLGFAVAAHLDSEIMIMDEVLAVGDMEFQQKCLNRMREVAETEGRTILYVSHNMNTIRRLCDRCIVMDEGKIIFDGDVDKAVSMYLGMDAPTKKKVVFGPDHRPFDRYLRGSIRMNFVSLEVLKEEPVYRSGETALLCVTCAAEKAFSRVGFRFELWSSTGVKVGSMLSGSFADLEEGENRVLLRMDTTHLASGQYRADMVAFLFDEDGNEVILDGVYPGLQFEVTPGTDAADYLDWHHQYWGSVRLHDLQVETEVTGG